jgi:hypothetical protein
MQFIQLEKLIHSTHPIKKQKPHHRQGDEEEIIPLKRIPSWVRGKFYPNPLHQISLYSISYNTFLGFCQALSSRFFSPSTSQSTESS